jgi:mannose-6-phosphate isomerase-like protein (cupin superfamily)
LVWEGSIEHEINHGDVVVVAVGSARGIKAIGEEQLEALLITAPSTTDEEHNPVRKGIRNNEFDPSA